MNRNMRSHSLIRTLILSAATLAIVGVLFAVYQSITGGPPVGRPLDEQTQAELIPPASLASDPTGRGVALTDNVVLGSGARGSIRLYGAVSDQPKAVLAYRAWEPVAEADNQFQVTAPQISLRTPRGQLVEISATSGMVQLKTMQSERLALSKGKLVGDVEIKIDRLDEQQRAALPPEQRDKPGPDRLITMRLEEVDFDLEYAQLETDGPFHLESAEFDIRLQGLFLRYNELDSSIEELRTESSGR
ncbi:MAG: hypothetical protein ACYS7M_09470, partial [Planctomycetota bacterium]